MKTQDITVVGSVNSDVTYHVATLPQQGETILAHGRFDAPGGKGANQAAALAALGQPVRFVGCVGNDDRGESLVSHLENLGVDCGSVTTTSQAPTGSAVVVVASDGENSIVVHPGANFALTPQHVTQTLAASNNGYVLVQFEVPLDAAYAALTAGDARVVVNPAPMPEPSALLDDIIARADILVPNRTELAGLANAPLPQTIEEVTQCVRTLTVDAQIVVTLGSDGALVFPKGPSGDAVAVSAPAVDTVDSSGAGDAFCAALVAGVNAGHPLEDAAQFACNFAAWTTTLHGAQVTQLAPEDLTLGRPSVTPSH